MDRSDKKIFGLKESNFLIAIFVTALFIRVAYTLYMRLILNTPIINDEIRYDTFAYNLAFFKTYKMGCSHYAFYSPGLPLILALIYKILGYDTLAAGIFISVLSALIPVFIFLISKKIFNKEVGTIAAIIAVFNPYYIWYAPLLVTETVVVLLPLISIYLLILARENFSYKYLAPAALLLGYSTLTKPSTIFFPFIVVLYLYPKDRKTTKNFVLGSAAFVLVFIAVLAPWAIRNYIVLGKPVFTSTCTGQIFFGGNNFSPSREIYNIDLGIYTYDESEIGGNIGVDFFQRNELEISEDLIALGIHELTQNYKRIPELLLKKLIYFWSFRPDPSKKDYTKNDILSLVFYGPILILFLIGFFKTFRPRDEVFIFHLSIFYFTFLALVFWGTPRFRLPISPYIIILASATIYGIFKSHYSKRAKTDK